MCGPGEQAGCERDAKDGQSRCWVLRQLLLTPFRAPSSLTTHPTKIWGRDRGGNDAPQAASRLACRDGLGKGAQAGARVSIVAAVTFDESKIWDSESDAFDVVRHRMLEWFGTFIRRA
jgi:hypothetical protein